MQLFFGKDAIFAHSVSENPPPQIQPPLVVTQFSHTLEFIEVYNQSSEAINLKIVELKVSSQNRHSTQDTQASKVELPNAWLLPKQYLLLHRDAISISPNTVSLSIDHPLQNDQIHSLMVGVLGLSYSINNIDGDSSLWMQHKQRGNASLKISMDALNDYTSKSTSPISFADSLYYPAPAPTGLKIIEVLPNANSCAPNDTSSTCSDYIKLYNSSSDVMSLHGYRLRTDSGGIKSSTSNTITLGGAIVPGETRLINIRDSGDALAVTNTGGYVWIEDAQGVIKYEETIVSYPDATTAAGKGMSWAMEMETGAWRWMVPRPHDVNFWSVSDASTNVVNGQAECPAGKERNLETNRCRNVSSTTSNQTPCKPGQERNVSTNRCRNITTATTAQKPCTTGQYRSLETGRCRKVQAATSPAPCKANQERNPLTGRCKKIIKKSGDIANIEDVASAQKSDKKMLLYAGAGLVAASGYGIYEWRQEIGRRLFLLRRGKLR